MPSRILKQSLLALMTLLSLSLMPVHAHNVVGGVYAIGNQIEGEIGFSNGDMAAQGTEIKVSDAQGNLLGMIETDSEGLFVFTAQQRIDHQFFANLSSGHVLELLLPADELPESLPGGNAVSNADMSQTSTPVNFTGDQIAFQQMIEKAVAKQVKPLRKELAEYKEKASLQDVIGGIGYIFGLCGIGIWWRQRQLDQLKKQSSSEKQGQV
ncbi:MULTISPECIES: hypothetical protein [unclassified Neptuniibacter]|uniref:hypothetical protein n=1 Tax=unclassified Neptuniibacter TaxID=2630693 RepID=UPI0025CCC49A|nr:MULTISPECIES: hypothetical protein [unclassified Neptuniibacter]